MANATRTLHDVTLERSLFRQLFPDEYGKYRELILTQLREDTFFSPQLVYAFRYYNQYLVKYGEIPDFSTLLSEPRLQDDHLLLLRSFSLTTNPGYTFKSERAALEAVKKLNDLAYLRRIARSTAEVSAKLHDPEMSVEDVSAAWLSLNEDMSSGVDPEDDRIYTYGRNTEKLRERLLDPERKSALYPTPFETFNNAMGGVAQHGLGLLGACTSGGKSAMANKLLVFWAKMGLRVCKISLEMGEDEEYMRFNANIAGVDMRAMLEGATMTAADRDKILASEEATFAEIERAGGCLDFYCPDKASLERLLVRIRPYNYDIVVVDYIGLLDGADDDQQALRLSGITRTMKRVTQRTKQLIIGLVQIDDKDGRIRYAKAMKEHADWVWTWNPSEAEKISGEFTMSQIKGRNTGLFSWSVKANWRIMDFTDAGAAQSFDEDLDEDGNQRIPNNRDLKNPRGFGGRRSQSRQRTVAVPDASLSD